MNNINLTSQIELTIKCSDLPNKDIGSHSDPLCLVKLRNVDTNKYEEIGRTERIENTLDPEFVTKILVTFAFETKQDLQFKVYDCDEGNADPDDADKLGQIEVTMAEVVQGRLRNGKQMKKCNKEEAMIYVSARETVDCRQNYVFNFVGRGLDNKDGYFGKSDPFLIFYKQIEDGSYTPVGQTEVVKDDLNPVWPPYTINAGLLCDNDAKKSIKVDCFDFDSDGSHDLIGCFVTTAEELIQGCGQREHHLINEKKKAKKSSYDNSGVIVLRNYAIDEDWEFSHFVQSGLQLSINVAIDFTGSNGDPRDPRSLHYFNPEYPYNQYTTAIDSVGQVIQDYDSDKLFPVFGFGGVFFGGNTSHCHPLNNNLENPNVVGVQGILDAYRYALSQSHLSGPTNFEHVIHNATLAASQNSSGLSYFILLIITDGAITDMEKTKAAIVRASRYPISIIIVGVGRADFSSMEELDSDKKMLTDPFTGSKADRDIVQFVPMREVFGDSYDPAIMVKNQHKLAKKVLAEVPKQVKKYMKQRNLKPIDIYNAYQKAFPQLNNAVPLENNA